MKAVAQERRFGSGDVIFEEGAPGDGLYILREGEVEISSEVGAEQHRVVTMLGPGESFGEMALIDGEPRSAGAIAASDCILSFLPREALDTQIEANPKLAAALMRQISGRLRRFTQQYLREVLQAERLAVVGRFTRSILHDVKNPLNTIGISAEVLAMEDTSTEERHDTARGVRRQVERITDMINEVFEFTKGGKPAFVPARIDFASYLQPLLENCRDELAAQGVRLEVEGELPEVALLVHPKRLTRVFVNLLQNASEAMDNQGTVTVRCTVEPDKVVTEVEDDGPGIAPEVADRLFEPFATYGKAQGTGLGLAIAKRIVTDHNGTIEVRPGSRGGARFIVSLPRPAAD